MQCANGRDYFGWRGIRGRKIVGSRHDQYTNHVAVLVCQQPTKSRVSTLTHVHVVGSIKILFCRQLFCCDATATNGNNLQITVVAADAAAATSGRRASIASSYQLLVK